MNIFILSEHLLILACHAKPGGYFNLVLHVGICDKNYLKWHKNMKVDYLQLSCTVELIALTLLSLFSVRLSQEKHSSCVGFSSASRNVSIQIFIWMNKLQRILCKSWTMKWNSGICRIKSKNVVLRSRGMFSCFLFQISSFLHPSTK